VGRAVPWYRDIHALVCARFIPQVARVAQFMERFLRFTPLWLLTILSIVAQVKSAQSGTGSTPDANPGRPTVSTPATLTPIGYLQSENGALSAEHSTEFSRRFGIGRVTKLSVLPRLELLLRGSRWQSVIDAGFNQRLTDTSTRWEILAGFTYLLPHRLSINRLG
jgi:hypothetical protein